jgi:KaiC/GvpD/RAD55 family RecA-like ATPase
MEREAEESIETVQKMRTGIEGFDEISGGGLPRDRTTLITGGPGSGKTVFALNTLHRLRGEQQADHVQLGFLWLGSSGSDR